MDSTTITQEVFTGALNFGSSLVNELLAKENKPPVETSEEVIFNVATGMANDEEDIIDEEEDVVFDSDDDIEREAHKVMEETPKGYPKGEPIKVSQYNAFIQQQEQYKTAGVKAVNNAGMYTSFINTDMQRQAAQKTKKDAEEFVFGSGTYEINGKSKKCTEVAFNFEFKGSEDAEVDLENLSDAITIEVIRNFPKVHSIAVSSGYLIINGCTFIPNIKDTDAKFPLDTVEYVNSGCIAPLVNWRKLLKHSKRTCASLSIDSTEFYITYIGDSVGLGRRIGVSSAFKLLDNLDMFYLEGECVTREKLESPESANVKKKLASKKRNFKIMDGYKLDICKGTQGFQDFAFKSLKDYATNRGNRGYIRYALGTVARFGFATVGGLLNLGTHLTRGIWRGGKELVKSALTPVEDEDIYNQ